MAVRARYSTQTCNCCNKRTGPKGLEGRGIGEWTRPECGAYHRRDINAAVNILAAGRRRLAEGMPVLSAPCARAEGRGPGGRKGYCVHDIGRGIRCTEWSAVTSLHDGQAQRLRYG
ncbi:zinc ribbon domain-containing protein [Paraburkholderia azotifigens]|uniref:zinc ribbon domain-containing protein n=1 Tax=Paraburkholderia azotifigens TaxID=2057004 RepID=UPI001EFF8FB5|nr:zinc ribbon domain-containing protein [Paraburkholderia azotifigens]